MDPLAVIESVDLFEGATREDLEAVAEICRQRSYQAGELITQQGEIEDELFVIYDGFVEVLRSSSPDDPAPRTVVNLGRGQIFGEMALVDLGPRSASVRAVSKDTTVLVIRRDEFEALCQSNHRLGYLVMRNIAADLSFKLRHRHLTNR